MDSPAGQLAWILDKFAEWTDHQDNLYEVISRDRLLDNVTLYWLTATGASSARIYYESHNSLDPDLLVDVPTAVTDYPGDIFSTHPRPWAEERYRRIVRWNRPQRGGNFPAMEIPGYFAEDLRAGLSEVLRA